MKTTVKTMLSTLLGALLPVEAFAAPQFVELRSDKPTYAVGERAVLSAYVKIRPDNPNYEIFLSATLAGSAIKVTRISDTWAASISPTFPVAESLNWDVEVYLQDKRLAHGLEVALAGYEAELCKLHARLDAETDPAIRQQIQDQIARDQGLIEATRDQLTRNRRLVELDRLTIQVTPTSLLTPEESTPVLTIRADHDFNEYRIGERATFTVRVNSDFTGPDGPRENVIRAKIDAQDAPVQQNGPKSFSSFSPAFVASDVGQHHYLATLYTRSKAQANSLRDAIKAANSRRADMVTARDQTEDLMEKAYYQRQIDDLTTIITAFYEQLEAGLQLSGSGSIGFTVLGS